MSNDEIKVSLRIVGDELSPEEITVLLGCQPTESRMKGDELRSQSFISTAPTGIWLLSSSITSSVEDAVFDLLNQVDNDPSVWSELTKRFRTEFFVGVFSETCQVGITVSASIIQKLSVLGLSIGIDVYCDLGS